MLVSLHKTKLCHPFLNNMEMEASSILAPFDLEVEPVLNPLAEWSCFSVIARILMKAVTLPGRFPGVLLYLVCLIPIACTSLKTSQYSDSFISGTDDVEQPGKRFPHPRARVVLVGNRIDPQLGDELAHRRLATSLLHLPEGLSEAIGTAPDRDVDRAWIVAVDNLDNAFGTR